jgi:hypothetical protein
VHIPRGELRVEADRAVIEILPRLGRHAEALVETHSFLDANPDAEDRAELWLMCGDTFRAIFQDMLSAEHEYDEGAEADGRTGDDSRSCAPCAWRTRRSVGRRSPFGRG